MTLCAYCTANGRPEPSEAFSVCGSPLSVNSQPCCLPCMQAILDLYHSDSGGKAWREMVEREGERR